MPYEHMSAEFDDLVWFLIDNSPTQAHSLTSYHKSPDYDKNSLFTGIKKRVCHWCPFAFSGCLCDVGDLVCTQVVHRSRSECELCLRWV